MLVVGAVVGVVVRGPLVGYAVGFAEVLSARGYAPTSIVLRVRVLAHLSRWLLAEGVLPWGCDEAVLGRFLAARQADHVDLSSAWALDLVVSFLRSVGAVPLPAGPVAVELGSVEDVLDRWGLFLADERGLTVTTIRYYRFLGRPFLVPLVHDGVVAFGSITELVVASFVRETLPGLPVGSAKLTITALRSLLRFLFVSGDVGQDLAPLVPARAGYRDAGLPRGLSPEAVSGLLAAVDSASVKGRRDRAVVLLLLRLGLRSVEVAGLSLEDLDWRAGTVRILGKGGQSDVLPLPADVGEALAAHLQSERRPEFAGRAVFAGSRAPYRPATAAMVTGIVRSLAKEAGLGSVGAHRLRHSVGAATINAGASLEEVGQLLRHRSLSSTTIYAKVDLVRLATVARPWPGIGSGLEARP